MCSREFQVLGAVQRKVQLEKVCKGSDSSGTEVQSVLTDLACDETAKANMHVHAPDGSTFLCEMMSRLPSWKCDVQLKV